MPSLIKLLLLLSTLWAVLALSVQVLIAWGGGRRDHSRAAGCTGRGVAYNFTVAMLPRHKESVRRHPFSFALGVTLHVGVMLSVATVVTLLAWPDVGSWFQMIARPLVAVALLAGAFLLVRRAASTDLKAMSSPDDYIAIVVTCGLLAFVLMARESSTYVPLFLYATFFFAYLPLGKLRHAVFFFVARADCGRRLGYRGVYPPSAAETE